MSEVSLIEFADKLNTVLPVVMREIGRRQTNEVCKGKITFQQMLIMEYIYREGRLSMTHLAHFMQVSTAAMTGIIQRLVREGYAVRLSDPKDRRIIKIRLTPKSVTLIKKLAEDRRRMIMNIFGRISQDERQDYLKILMHIQEILLSEKNGAVL